MTSRFVVLCDLDGVIWLAHEPLPGSAEAIGALRSAGHRVLFVTNNSYATRGEQEGFLHSVGIPAAGDVVTSAMAAASLVDPGSRVLICGGPGLVEAVRERGAEPVDVHEETPESVEVDAVVVGFHTTFDYRSLRRASTAIRRGARFIASNDDPTYPTPDGPVPGGGSILAAVATAAGREPTIAGKPHVPMADLVRTLAPGVGSETVMIGDRPSTDGLFAERLGCRFALVRSEITREGDVRIRPDFDGESLEAVARTLLEGKPGTLGSWRRPL